MMDDQTDRLKCFEDEVRQKINNKNIGCAIAEEAKVLHLTHGTSFGDDEIVTNFVDFLHFYFCAMF
jgi:hypothetical protein